MGAIDTAIKGLIVRLARKEARKITSSIRDEVKRLKKRNVELKAAISAVDEQTKKMYAKGRLEETASKAASGQVKGRLSPRLVKSLRSKMGLSQGKFAKLLGVSLGSVVNWELGKMNPRPEMRQKMLSFRGMGRREVKLILENL